MGGGGGVGSQNVTLPAIYMAQPFRVLVLFALLPDTIKYARGDYWSYDHEHTCTNVTRYEKTDHFDKLTNLQERAQNSAKSTSVEIFFLSFL